MNEKKTLDNLTLEILKNEQRIMLLETRVAELEEENEILKSKHIVNNKIGVNIDDKVDVNISDIFDDFEYVKEEEISKNINIKEEEIQSNEKPKNDNFEELEDNDNFEELEDLEIKKRFKELFFNSINYDIPDILTLIGVIIIIILKIKF